MFDKAVQNIIKNCLRLSTKDRFVIVSDIARQDIGKSIYEKAKEVCETKIFFIEEFTKRPAKEFPTAFEKDITKFMPTASLYAATGQEGELPLFRSKLIALLTKNLNCRHAHMIGVDEKIMETGMSMDYSLIYKASHKLYEILKNATEIEVKDPHGTSLKANFSKEIKWKADDGVPLDNGRWCNLPAGEVFTCPVSVNGQIVAWELGDYFSEKYGVLKNPIMIYIKNSFITNVKSKNKKLKEEFESYVKKYSNGNRVGEFAIGCLMGLEKLIGNLLQDEKFPGVHLAFGHPYPEMTGVQDWNCESHVDVIPLNVSAFVDGKEILKNRKFTIDLT
ncbi:MAG: aminopeptidase [Patescibacteria group bacterium]|nr:aminopeptidase [Patescibacteria group bacterium]